MLILTRRPTESFMIGEHIRIEVLGVQGNQVRIGIQAPREVAVHREEVFRRIEAAKAKDGSDGSGPKLPGAGADGEGRVR